MARKNRNGTESFSVTVDSCEHAAIKAMGFKPQELVRTLYACILKNEETDNLAERIADEAIKETVQRCTAESRKKEAIIEAAVKAEENKAKLKEVVYAYITHSRECTEYSRLRIERYCKGENMDDTRGGDIMDGWTRELVKITGSDENTIRDIIHTIVTAGWKI